MEITVPWEPIKALAHLAADSDIRKYLTGVWIDSSGPYRIVVASNGGMLGVYKTDEPSTDVPAVFIPLHIVKACKGFSRGVTIKVDADRRASIEWLGTRHYWQDDGFAIMDWRRALPRTRPSGVSQQFNAERIGAFVKVHKALGLKWREGAVRIAHDGGRPAKEYAPARVTLPDVPQFAGALMPVNWDDAGNPWTEPIADWVHERHGVTAPADSALDLV